MLGASAAQGRWPHEQGECLPSETECSPCALVVDEVKQVEGELAQLARGERSDGLCGDPFEPPPDGSGAVVIEVEFASPDGPAVVGLLPEPRRVEVPGRLTLRGQRSPTPAPR
jgi:hypothetical protein